MTGELELWLRIGRKRARPDCAHDVGFDVILWDRSRRCVGCGLKISDLELMNMIRSQRERIQTLTRQMHAHADY